MRFSEEFYQTGLFEYEADMDGATVLYMHAKLHRKISFLTFQENLEKCLLYNAKKIDERHARIQRIQCGLRYNHADDPSCPKVFPLRNPLCGRCGLVVACSVMPGSVRGLIMMAQDHSLYQFARFHGWNL